MKYLILILLFSCTQGTQYSNPEVSSEVQQVTNIQEKPVEKASPEPTFDKDMMLRNLKKTTLTKEDCMVYEVEIKPENVFKKNKKGKLVMLFTLFWCYVDNNDRLFYIKSLNDESLKTYLIIRDAKIKGIVTSKDLTFMPFYTKEEYYKKNGNFSDYELYGY